jgi:hypothetical protein
MIGARSCSTRRSRRALANCRWPKYMGKKGDKKRGAKGGIKHQPGKEHDRKSAPAKKKRFAKKAARKRQQAEEESKKQWEQWDALSDEQKRLLGPQAAPKVPRPTDES